MKRLSASRVAVTAFALILALAALTGGTQAQANPGYLWLRSFSADTVGSSGQVTLAGRFVNACTNPIPSGSHLRIYFDEGVLLNVLITAGSGQTQHFSGTVTVPQVQRPQDNVTAYRFTIIVPASTPATTTLAKPQPDMKTSPCLVTPVLGIPSP